MIQCIIAAHEEVHNEPGDREEYQADIKPVAYDECFLDNMFSYKIKTDPG
jgi:hypothetical protein